MGDRLEREEDYLTSIVVPTRHDARRDARCFVFLHVPKTAGRTLRSSLMWSFAEDETIQLDVLDRPLDEEIEKIPAETRSRARLVWGHMPFGVHGHMRQRCEYFTILREPIGRVISVYKYVLRTQHHVLHDVVVREGITFEEYLASRMDEGQTENAQTRQLSGRQFGTLDREALEEAKRNLQGFLVVGLTERFEETFALLRRTLRLRIPFYVTRNVSPPFKASPRALELIRELNELDLELYTFAQDLFAEQVARQSRSFGLEVTMFRAMRPLLRVAGGREEFLRKLMGRRLFRKVS